MAQFSPDRGTYLRYHAVMAAIAMAAAMGGIALFGEPSHAWTGAIGALAAIAFRGWFLLSEVMDEHWHLTETTLKGPGARAVPLTQINKLRTLAGAVQVITSTGDKHLIKYQADPAAVIARIEEARDRARQDSQ